MAYGFVKYVNEKIFWIEGNMPIFAKIAQLDEPFCFSIRSFECVVYFLPAT